MALARELKTEDERAIQPTCSVSEDGYEYDKSLAICDWRLRAAGCYVMEGRERLRPRCRNHSHSSSRRPACSQEEILPLGTERGQHKFVVVAEDNVNRT